MSWAVRGRSSSVFAPSVWCGPRNRKAIALTFDDGPSESTPLILEELARYKIQGTFFQCGANVRRIPEIARQVAAAGHEIGNHSDTHPMMCLRAGGFVYDELARAQECITETTGCKPKHLRVPYGVRWFGLRPAQRRLGLLGVMWTVIGRDWKLPAGQIADRVLSRVGNGAIICLHDGRGLGVKPDVNATVEAVRMIVPELLARGYKVETVARLLG
jgi:peptidoglycan/xylan/chitin deacetylase (PgdA/CDA1 family)